MKKSTTAVNPQTNSFHPNIQYSIEQQYLYWNDLMMKKQSRQLNAICAKLGIDPAEYAKK